VEKFAGGGSRGFLRSYLHIGNGDEMGLPRGKGRQQEGDEEDLIMSVIHMKSDPVSLMRIIERSEKRSGQGINGKETKSS